MWPDCQHDPIGLALLQGCKDHPTELDRRLILAYWLEDQGEAAVAQCLRQSLATPRDWVAFAVKDIARWRPLSGCLNGLPGVVGAPVRLRHSPWCCSWICVGCPLPYEALTALLALPDPGHLLALKLNSNEIDDAGVAALAASPALCRLRSLNLAFNRIGNPGAAALAHSEYLTSLTHLVLHHNRIDTAGRRSLEILQNRGVEVVV